MIDYNRLRLVKSCFLIWLYHILAKKIRRRVKVCLVRKNYNIRTYGGLLINIPVCSVSALDWGRWSVHFFSWPFYYRYPSGGRLKEKINIKYGKITIITTVVIRVISCVDVGGGRAMETHVCVYSNFCRHSLAVLLIHSVRQILYLEIH
jgi:hypothetical protein